MQNMATTSANGTDGGQAKTPVVIEGYQVFKENEGQPGVIVVKQEPLDPEYQNPSETEYQNNGQTNEKSQQQVSHVIREQLRQMVDNKGKELTVKNVVEGLLQKNEFILAQSDAQSFKPHTRTVKPKIPDESSGNHGTILQPKDPTISCTTDDIGNINDALVEMPITDTDSNTDPDLVCAVGSKVVLMTPTGQSLQMDLTCYWCNFCSFKTDKKDALLHHVMKHRFHCKYCKFQSFSRAAVIRHGEEMHSAFNETAATLKYCIYLPDLLQRNEMKKRKATDPDLAEPNAKKSKSVKEVESELNMEVDEVDEEENQETTVERILTPTKKATARKSLPAPVKHLLHKKISRKSSVTPGDESLMMPVITNVMSGHLAVSEATGLSSPEPTPPVQKTASTGSPGPVTVSSGLCWNCGYCGFVTLSQAFLKIHLNATHQGKAHKYVAMLVSSEEEMTKIKASDAQLAIHPTGTLVLNPAGPSASSPMITSSNNIASNTPTVAAEITSVSTIAPTKLVGIEIDNAETDPVSKSKEETEEEKKIPISFKCAHCNFSSPEASKVKIHLFQRHSGCVMYALDMKAVKLRNMRYVFFCMKSTCTFETKQVEAYLEHIKECTPWLDGNEPPSSIDSTLVKSLELTKQFILKTAGSIGQKKDFRPDKVAEYSCVYCSYISNNNTRLKKHVLSNHPSKSCVIRDQQAEKNNRQPTVYFCMQCLWETREGAELEIHMEDRHGKSSDKSTTPTVTPVASTSTSTPSATPPLTDTQKTVGESADDLSAKTPTSPSYPGLVIKPNRKEENTLSSNESSPVPTGNETDEEDSEGDRKNEYLDIVSPAIYEKAMKDYISNDQEKKQGRGRPPRNAALKAKLLVKSFNPPPLYSCLHCTFIAFGVKLMRAHINEKHKNIPLRAVDILKQSKKVSSPYFCFCPNQECTYAGTDAKDIVNHAKNVHKMKSTHSDLVLLCNAFVPPAKPIPPPSRGGRPATAATGESYECLYCTTAMLYHSRRDMKKHLAANHAGDPFIYRDCIARKLKQTSRFYMCEEETCDFTAEKQKDTALHLLGHRKAKIYECSKCQWFTCNVEEVAGHREDVHDGEEVVNLQFDLAIDSQGKLVKFVNGTLIKSECDRGT